MLVEKGGPCQTSSSLIFHLLSETQSLTEPSPRVLLAWLPAPVLGYKCVHPHLACTCLLGLNPGLRACNASASPTQPAHSPSQVQLLPSLFRGEGASTWQAGVSAANRSLPTTKSHKLYPHPHPHRVLWVLFKSSISVLWSLP